MLELTLPQTVSVRRGTFRPHLATGLTPTPADGAMVEALLLLGHGRGWRGRLGGLAAGGGGGAERAVKSLVDRGVQTMHML